MTTFILIRHGHCDPIGRFIAGRMSGIHLSETGKKQAKRVANKLRDIELSAIFSSPLERAMETAASISEGKGIDISIKEELIEIDYGLWTGKSFEELSIDPLWAMYNDYKGKTRIPGGEMMVEVASRMSHLIETLRRAYNGVVVLVSHGDPIKSAIAHYAGIPLDFIIRFDVQPASVSTLSITDSGAQLLTLNTLVES